MINLRPQQSPSLSTGQVAVVGTPLLVLGENPMRLAAAVVNLGPAIVYLGINDRVSIHNGFALLPGGVLGTDNPTPLYVVAAASGTTVSFVEESAA